MQALWKGVIVFGLVSLPVRLFAASDTRSVSLRQLCDRHKAPLRYRRWCDAGDHEVPLEEVKKGYEVSKDHYVVIEDSDLEDLPLPTAHTIPISEFVPLGEIEASLYFRSPYYVVPEQVGRKPYQLLAQALSDTGMVALAKIAFRDRERLCALQGVDGQLLMNTLRWPHEIRRIEHAESSDGKVEVNPRELQMAKSLVRSLAAPAFDPDHYQDNYQSALMQVVRAKVEGADLVHVPVPTATSVMGLMDALKASVEDAKKRRRAADRPAKKPARAQKKPA